MDVGIVMPCSALTPPDLIAETATPASRAGEDAVATTAELLAGNSLRQPMRR